MLRGAGKRYGSMRALVELKGRMDADFTAFASSGGAQGGRMARAASGQNVSGIGGTRSGTRGLRSDGLSDTVASGSRRAAAKLSTKAAAKVRRHAHASSSVPSRAHPPRSPCAACASRLPLSRSRLLIAPGLPAGARCAHERRVRRVRHVVLHHHREGGLLRHAGGCAREEVRRYDGPALPCRALPTQSPQSLRSVISTRTVRLDRAGSGQPCSWIRQKKCRCPSSTASV